MAIIGYIALGKGGKERLHVASVNSVHLIPAESNPGDSDDDIYFKGVRPYTGLRFPFARRVQDGSELTADLSQSRIVFAKRQFGDEGDSVRIDYKNARGIIFDRETPQQPHL